MEPWSIVFVSVRLALAAIFCVAGVSKLLDLPGTRRVLKEFRVPGFAVGPVALLLPVLEIATAAALIPPFSSTWGGFRCRSADTDICQCYRYKFGSWP